MAISKGADPINTLQDWERLAGPKSAGQWVDGRSAKESARAWLQSNGTLFPHEVATVLANHPAFGPVGKWAAEPEAKLRFDRFAGEPRNSDLVVHAEDAKGRFLIAVEAKADEPFGPTVAQALSAALERHLENDSSNGIARIQQLAKSLFGSRQPGDPPIRDIRYQLLTACAGAMCEAERAGYDRVLVLVHEFVTEQTLDEKHRRNAADLNQFLRRISHSAVATSGPGIFGPFTVPGLPLLERPGLLFVGKVTRDLRP